MHEIGCAKIWGGVRDENVDVCSRAIEASLYSASSDGGKGGDIYYLSVCGDDILTRVALADVAGHGEAVSHVSQWLYDSLEARMDSPDGFGILEDLNGLATEHGIKAMTTVALAGFYRDHSKLYFSYAGHHPMLVHRHGEAHWKPLEMRNSSPGPANLPLGVFPGARYDQGEIQLGSKDRLFLYTDGVIEAPGCDGDRFGLERLCTVLDANSKAGLAELKSSVLDAALDFTEGSLAHDDLTLIAVSVR